MPWIKLYIRWPKTYRILFIYQVIYKKVGAIGVGWWSCLHLLDCCVACEFLQIDIYIYFFVILYYYYFFVGNCMFNANCPTNAAFLRHNIIVFLFDIVLNKHSNYVLLENSNFTPYFTSRMFVIVRIYEFRFQFHFMRAKGAQNCMQLIMEHIFPSVS